MRAERLAMWMDKVMSPSAARIFLQSSFFGQLFLFSFFLTGGLFRQTHHCMHREVRRMWDFVAALCLIKQPGHTKFF